LVDIPDFSQQVDILSEQVNRPQKATPANFVQWHSLEGQVDILGKKLLILFSMTSS
jgi:hypothetical protein